MFDITIDGEHARLMLSGDVDLQTTADLKQEIAKLNGISHFEVHAGHVSYIDSSGVAVLLYARQHCLQRQVSFAIPVVSQPLFRVLELAHLQGILPIGQVVDGPDMAVDDAAFLNMSGSVDSDLEDFLPPEPALDKPAIEKPAIEKPAIEKPALDEPALAALASDPLLDRLAGNVQAEIQAEQGIDEIDQLASGVGPGDRFDDAMKPGDFG